MAGACESISHSAPSGIPTSCGGWRSARRMCCSWRRIFCVNKPCGVNRIEQARQGARNSGGENCIFSSRREGNWRAFSFYEVEANLAWIHSLPPSAMCLRPTEIEGSVARDDLASRLRFPNQILCVVTGKGDAEV